MFLKISQLFYRIMQSESLQQQEFGISDPEGPSSPVEDFPSCTKEVKAYLCGLNLTPSTHNPIEIFCCILLAGWKQSQDWASV